MEKLSDALRPFAEVPLPPEDAGDDVWIYVGRSEEHGRVPALSVADFKAARAALDLE